MKDVAGNPDEKVMFDKKGNPIEVPYGDYHWEFGDAPWRFWDSVHKARNGCWNWMGAINTDGYGTFNFYGENKRAHRFSYELHRGPIPQGLFCCHHCDNRRCVNPAHLFLGTALDNIQDMHRKGRANPPRGARAAAAKLTEDDVREIRRRYAEGDVTYGQLATEYGVHYRTPQAIVLRRTWKHVAPDSYGDSAAQQ